ncbi:MAG: hypothetical protein JWN61_2147 [Pseudonocardiales bacterium]|nr:hypothetical protein [Pseudonocardiales bacterium]
MTARHRRCSPARRGGSEQAGGSRAVGEPVDHGRELRLTAVALAITSGLAGVVLVLMASALWGDIGGGHFERSVAAAISDAAVLALVYGGLAYHWARWGCHSRQATAQSGEREDSDSDGLFHPDADAGLLTVLIPSYCEGLEVVRQTALSAALQDFPDRRVVILVDDPPVPEDPAQEAALQAVRMLPRLIEELLAGPAQAMAAEERAFLARTDGGVLTSEALRTEAARIRRLYREAGRWFDERAAEEPTDDHTARLFTELTFRARGRSCRDRAAQLIE